MALVATVMCILTSIEASILTNSSSDSVDAELTTRDVYGAWTLTDIPSESSSESEEYTSSTKSLFRKHYWYTPGWTISSTKQKKQSGRRMTGRFATVAGVYMSKPRGRPTINKTRRIVTGRWPSSKNGTHHSVPPGFGRPRMKSKKEPTLFGETRSHRHGPTKWNGTSSRTYFVKTFKMFTESRRHRLVNNEFRSRRSPYFRWHTASDQAFLNGSRVKISRGPRRPYGTRKPPRPRRFQWFRPIRSPKPYAGNLTCRLFIMRSRTTILLISPKNVTKKLSYYTPMNISLSSLATSNDYYEENKSTTAQPAMSSPNQIPENILKAPDFQSHHITGSTNGTTESVPYIGKAEERFLVRNYTTENNEFPDLSYKLLYTPSSNSIRPKSISTRFKINR